MHPGPWIYKLLAEEPLVIVHFRGADQQTKCRVLLILTNCKPKSRRTSNSLTDPGTEQTVDKTQENKVQLLNGMYEEAQYRILDPSGKLITT